MASEVSICNQALSWLASNLITSLSDESREAQLCKANYAELRDSVLEEGSWTFATKRSIPAASPAEPAYGYGFKFPLPNDCIRVIEVQRDAQIANGENGMDWRLEDNYILCDYDIIYIKYITQVTDPKKFSPSFVQALAARLAADLAIPLTQNRQLQSDMVALYSAKLDTALSSDGSQGRRDRIRQRAYHRVR